MSKLSFYSNISEKEISFNQSNPTFYNIDNASQFLEWYDWIKSESQNLYENFFRGMSEAKYKLYNSAQRYWIQNNLCDLEKLKSPSQTRNLVSQNTYSIMIQNMVNKAKQNNLFQQVFEYYDIDNEHMDFPILSILQHYGAPTPLMDWTYNVDIALFFAIENLKKCEFDNLIENYISVYRINKQQHTNFIINNLQAISGNVFPSVLRLSDFLGNDKVVYISDFETTIAEDFEINNFFELEKSTKKIRKIRPLTTYYNLNILAQKGIFIFNPHESLPLEEFSKFNIHNGIDDRIFCYNINKDLIELIKLKIKKNKIDNSFIYPDLKKYASSVLNDYIESIVYS